MGGPFGGMNGGANAGMSSARVGADGRGSMLPPPSYNTEQQAQPVNSTSNNNNNQQSYGGPIGSNRGFATTNSMTRSSYDDLSRERGQGGLPLRQPRGPAGPDRGTGFSGRSVIGGNGTGSVRQNGPHQGNVNGPSVQNDMDASSGVEIIVE
jgi:hypothetical protein